MANIGAPVSFTAQNLSGARDLNGPHKVAMSEQRRKLDFQTESEQFVLPLSFAYNLTYQAYPGLKTLISLATLGVETPMDNGNTKKVNTPRKCKRRYGDLDDQIKTCIKKTQLFRPLSDTRTNA